MFYGCFTWCVCGWKRSWGGLDPVNIVEGPIKQLSITEPHSGQTICAQGVHLKAGAAPGCPYSKTAIGERVKKKEAPVCKACCSPQGPDLGSSLLSITVRLAKSQNISLIVTCHHSARRFLWLLTRECFCTAVHTAIQQPAVLLTRGPRVGPAQEAACSPGSAYSQQRANWEDNYS